MKTAPRPYQLAIFTSHPIEYQAPFFKYLTENTAIDAVVYFFWDYGAKETYDPGFGMKVAFGIPLLDGYRHEFLKNIVPRPTSSHFWGEVNPSLVSRIGRDSCDAVLVLGWQTCSHWLAIFTAWVRRVPVFVRGENPLNQELRKPAWKRAIKQLIFHPFFRCVDGFLYIGEENRKFYRYYGVPEEKLFFMPYAVDNERFASEAARLHPLRAHKRAALGIPADACVFLFLGKLIPKKRPMDLLKAFEVVKAPAALVFVGDGVLRPELERHVREHKVKNVHLAGFKNQREIAEYYALADAFVLPSGDGETWGLVVNEAMNFGLPIVVSDVVGCAPDLVRGGENGFIFPAGDVEALAAALRALAADWNMRQRFGVQSVKIIQGYCFEKDIEIFLTALKQL